MRTVRELVCGLAGLFVLGVAGGLEKGLISIGGALLCWGISAVVISIVIMIERSMTNDRT